MPGKTVVVLGGGWGGLAAAHYLRGQLPPEHRVVVIEQKKAFAMCLSNLWIVTGERRYPADVERDMSKLAHPGIEWVQGEVQRLEPEARRVYVDGRPLQGDYVVIALGSEGFPEGVPGFAGSAYNLYDAQGADQLHRALPEFPGGKVVVLITRTPYRCPAAPYEAALLLDWLFRQRGIRDLVEIAVHTPEKQPMPVAGPAMGEALRSMLTGRAIKYYPEHTVSRIDGASHKLTFGAEEVSYDLLVGIPPHRAPRVVVEAGLTDGTGYIPTHPQTLRILSNVETLETRYPGVFALGDITAIRLPNQLLLPKAGVFAEGQARIVAQSIAAEIKGAEGADRFDGRGHCYVEVGEGMAAYAFGNFYAYPAPSLSLEPPSTRYKKDKEELERVQESWFTR